MPTGTPKPFGETLKQIASVKPHAAPEHQMLYMPILKGKAGELGALKELHIGTKSKILPLVEVPPVPWDYVNEKYAKTTSNHVKGFFKKLVESWGVDFPIIIDAYLLEDDDMDGESVIDFLLTQLHANSIEAIPTVRLGDDAKYLGIIQKHLKDVKRACLRITADDINGFDLASDIPILLAKLDVSAEDTDLLLDFKDVTNENETMYLSFSKMVIGVFPEINKYNSFTLAMTSFPENLMDYKGDSVSSISRIEWKIWNDLKNIPKLKRKPTFGDYGISSTQIADVDPRIMTMSANIRYTYLDHWVIIKGRDVKKYTFDQFYDLSNKIVNSDFFYGADFSWGDKTIEQKSRKEGGTGNATTWREVGTNHHIFAVVNQLSSSVSV